MATMKTPGVYIVEKSAFPNSAVEVATAVPAFIGYTEKALNGNESLLNKPFRLTSMAEFHSFFGGAPIPQFGITDAEEGQQAIIAGDKKVVVGQTNVKFTLYYQMLMFFANGGGPCYIVSVGDYTADSISPDALKAGVETLLKEQEPTMVLAPESVNIPDVDLCYSVQTAILSHCGYKMRNRVAILDVFDGYKDRRDGGDVVNTFREKIGAEFLDFGVVYYPWLNTSIVQDRDLSYLNFDKEALKALLEEDLKLYDETKQALVKEEIEKITDESLDEVGKSTLHKTLAVICPTYVALLKEAKRLLNQLPPSAAMAGIYTMVDNTKGVWKAPANVSVNSVISPAVNITSDDQEDLNVPLSGKAVNAIRSFVGEGIKVWGARTLDGNSLDWRYINVRRTMIMLEESVKNATRAYVFDPNVAGTWVNIKSMIQNFLNGVWKRGGLAGSTPDDAFSVHVGLGETMTPEDILEGILRITVLVAITRPAEFIEITFQQQMQKS
ncbi:phage tail sheath C-terminal domain-containing protein [Bacteroides sp. 51]|uniref:phage tail sheath family protein n=1 Tax=Bacteroides sp. 51 TaxID=2302938 RepID=UPI0013D1EEE4|nr:phage tail sheath C-terminal domain-containing protein [Bacteroides sp. 51]NDV82964.1 phage tail sheath family protein [Bacteroides sp. 51]